VPLSLLLRYFADGLDRLEQCAVHVQIDEIL
jgi:hypothetical protein